MNTTVLKNQKIINFYNSLKEDNINDSDLNIILNHLKNDINFSFVRFNDGEMMGIQRAGSIVARGDQVVNSNLRNKLIDAIKHRQDNYFIGIPCKLCYSGFYNLSKKYVKDYGYITKATLLTNLNWKNFILKFPKNVGNREIIWISGEDQKIDFLKEHLNLNITQHHKIPRKNSWKEYDKIKYLIKDFNDNSIVCLSCGPLSRVLGYEWFKENKNITFLDIGSTFDPFTRNVWHKCHQGWDKTGFNIQKRCKICN